MTTNEVFTVIISLVLISWAWLAVGALFYVLLPSDISERYKRLIIFGGPATLIWVIILLPFIAAGDALKEDGDTTR